MLNKNENHSIIYLGLIRTQIDLSTFKSEDKTPTKSFVVEFKLACIQ